MSYRRDRRGSDARRRGSARDGGGDPIPRGGVGQRAEPRLHVVVEVLGLARRGDDTGDGGVREDPLQEELAPAVAPEVGRPRRQRLAADVAEEGAFGEGTV